MGSRPWFSSWVGKIRWRRERLSSPIFLGFPCGSAGKESACNAGDLCSIPGLGRFPGEGKGCPLQHSGLENSMDYIVHRVIESRTWLSNFHFTHNQGSNPHLLHPKVDFSTTGAPGKSQYLWILSKQHFMGFSLSLFYNSWMAITYLHRKVTANIF